MDTRILAGQLGKFILSPISHSGEWAYKVTGSFDLFGDKLLRLGGAGGQS
jgi:hypothetical protein